MWYRCDFVWLLVFALHVMGDETYAIGKVKSTNNMRDWRGGEAATKGRGPADFNLKARGFQYGPVEMGGPVNEASTEYLDTHRDMIPMMKAAHPENDDGFRDSVHNRTSSTAAVARFESGDIYKHK